VGFGAVGISITIATVVGLTSGYFLGKWDAFVQRLVDAVIAFPGLVILLFVVAVLGPGLFNIIAALGILASANAARVIRSATLAIRGYQYVEAAQAMGASHFQILARHLLPNVFPTIIVAATVGLGGAILAEASLSFLGLGVPPPFPTWGGMLSGMGIYNMLSAPWIAFFPGFALSLTVFGFNMLGDGLRDVLDPRLRGR
jgi:peptide/nickel transport system permease protein